MRQRIPTHPGAILREDVIPALGISVDQFAKSLCITKHTLNSILSEHSRITPEIALKLGVLLGNDAHLWTKMQLKFDLWHQA
jgi:addiction module HigA family antidote